jgi:putative DNA primase/helicase
MSNEDVNDSVNGAQEFAPTVEDILAEATKLPPFQFAIQKKAIRDKLAAAGAKVTLGELDTEIERRRKTKGDQSKQSLLPESAQDPEPWHEAIDGAASLNQIRAFLQRFIIVEQHAYTALTLWIAFSYLLDIAVCAIRIAFLSPTKRCGKSRAMQVLELLSRRALASSSISPAAVYRTIDALGDASCTLLIDEADTFVGKANGDSDLVGILNASFDRPHAFVTRTVPAGERELAPKRFSTWAAIAYAFNLAKGRIPDTWLDRSIPVRMRRKRPGEKVEPLRLSNHRAFAEAFEIRRKLFRWSNDMREQLKEAEPAIPTALDSNDRAADGWHALLTIADAAGGPWPHMAREAATALCTDASDGADDSLGTALLADVKRMFDGRIAAKVPDAEKLRSKGICEELAKLKGHPWAEYGKAQKPITQNQLARLLKPFSIVPHTIRLADDSTPKGYESKDFKDAFECYLSDQKSGDAPMSGDSNRHKATTQRGEGESSDSRSATGDPGGAPKNGTSAYGEKDCGDMADKSSARGDVNEVFDDREEF